MKRNIQKLSTSIITSLFLLLGYSCTTNKWDDHYATPDYLNEGSVYTLLTKNPVYTEFRGLLKKTGYDSLLRRTDLYTVLAVKNGGFTAIDTTNNMVSLKRIIGTHIFPSSIFPQNMSNTNILACSGKPVNFSVLSDGHAANGFRISDAGTKGLNGVIYEIDHLIVPNLNLLETISGNPDFSLFSNYIATGYVTIPDPLRNTIIGYDLTNKPIYQKPVVYKQFSQYLNDVKIDDEKTVATAFIPTNNAINTVMSKLLQGRSGRSDLIVPKLGTAHGDTTIGYYFIPKGLAYQGDSAILKDYLFKNIIVNGKVMSLGAGINTFTNVAGNQFSVSSGQVQGNTIAASNGSYFTLNDVTLPDVVYRPRYMFVPSYKSATGVFSLNTGVALSGGTSTAIVYVTPSSATFSYRGFATRFNFVNIGGRIDFNLPFVTQGYYRVILKDYLDNNGCIVNVNCGSQLLKQNMNTSTLYSLAEGSADVDLGVVNVAANGPVQLTFTCAGVSPKAVGQYLFSVDIVTLVPVPAP